MERARRANPSSSRAATTEPRQNAESARLAAIHRDAAEGFCTNDAEDAQLTAVGGKDATKYGELTPQGFYALAHHIGLRADDSFYDAGSGLGRLVLQAARDFGVREACGIELASSRHALALRNLERESADVARRVKLIEGDCADRELWALHLADVSVIFISNLLFDAALNQRLLLCIEELAPRARVVATLLPIADCGLTDFAEPREIFGLETSWMAPKPALANATTLRPGSRVYLYRRKEASAAALSAPESREYPESANNKKPPRCVFFQD